MLDYTIILINKPAASVRLRSISHAVVIATNVNINFRRETVALLTITLTDDSVMTV